MCLFNSFSTLKQGCTAGVKLSLSDDCQYLRVIEVNEEHNHEINKVVFYIIWNVYVQYYSLFCVHVYVLVYELTHVNVHAIGPLPYRGKLSRISLFLAFISTKLFSVKSHFSTNLRKFSPSKDPAIR